LVFEFPHDSAVFDTQDQFMVGGSLLVQPVAAAGVTAVDVALPGGGAQAWYEYDTWQRHTGGRSVRLDAPLGRTPVLLRGGTVLPRRDRVRRASSLMHDEPLTLVVALDANGRADGVLYLDDGASFAYEGGEYAYKTLSYADGKLVCADVHESDAARAARAAGRSAFRAANRVGIERIILLGLPTVPRASQAAATEGDAPARPVPQQNGRTPTGTVIVQLKRPIANAAEDWSVSLGL
jgi:mannosyl-oligosaccharide alpha-1,3-glucosidase